MQGRSISRAKLEVTEWLTDVPRTADIPAMVELAARIIRQTGTAEDHFPTATIWRNLIDSKDVVCAKSARGQLAGFCVVNHFALTYETDDLLSVRAAYSTLCNRSKLPEPSVAFGAVIAVDPANDNPELRPLLFRALLRNVGYRYRHLFTTLRKDDTERLKLLSREGWRIFHEEDYACYLTIDVARALRTATSSIVLGMPQRQTVSVASHGTRL